MSTSYRTNIRDEGGTLKADSQLFKREKDALAVARRLSAMKAGVIAFSELADTAQVTILFSAGRTPHLWHGKLSAA
jgi:hypothetical protein